ncbi:MAG: DUF11 domain-containing protein [Deltaproteobacteria bacterium]|nr:DUF11 domain-containing protein [Deltaproteobacteria bacterium]
MINILTSEPGRPWRDRLSTPFFQPSRKQCVLLTLFAAAIAGLSPDPAEAQCPADSASATFAWSTSPGTGNEWLTSDQTDGASRMYSVSYTDTYGNPNSVDVTVAIQDPNGRSCDDNLMTDPSWPNDPDCTNGATETNGIFGSGFLTVAMKSLTSSETVRFDFTFSKPVFMDDFTISDLDDVGFGFQPTVEPGDSFQDRITLAATNGGSSVPISLVAGTNLTLAGQTATTIVAAGVNGNLLPGDAPGTLTASTTLPLDSFSLTYQNGPLDATNEGGNGISDSHAIRTSGFSFCVEDAAPQLAIDKSSSPSGTLQPGAALTYTVVITNNGPGNANQVELTDTLPAGVTYTSSSAQKTYPTANTGSFTAPNLGPATFDVAGLSQSLDTTGSIPAGATLSTYSFAVTGASSDFLSDISLSATYPGGTAYTLAAGTFGTGGAGGFSQIRGPDPFAGSAEGIYQFLWGDIFDGVAGDDNSITSATFTITYEAGRTSTTDAAGAPPNLVTAADEITLLPGETLTVTFDVTVDDPFPGGAASLTNLAEATATGLLAVTDTAINPVETEADVSIVKTLITASPYSSGQTVTYTLVVANAGPVTATDVVVQDAPTNLSITGVSGGGCSGFPCTIPSLPAGSSVTITVTATVP